MGKVAIQMPRKVTREIRIRNSHRLEDIHFAKYDKRTRSINRDIGNREIGEVLETAKPDAGEPAEAVGAGEGSERGNQIGREANGGNGAVDKFERSESGEGFESCERQSDIVGAIGQAEENQVSKRLGGVANGGVVK